MQIHWRSEIPHLVLIAGLFVVAAVAWPVVPDRIPVHWNFAGNVDRYGGKFEGVLAVPLMAAAMYVLMLFLPRIDPSRANYDNFRKAYGLIRFSLLAVLAAVYGCILLVAIGRPVDINLLVPLFVGVLFCVLGNVMGKLRPNWFVGVRTPWTLSSRASWNKTHRLAGRLFIIWGLTLVAYGFIQDSRMLAAVVGLGVVALVWMTVYSYLIWRDDPDRMRPAAGPRA